LAPGENSAPGGREGGKERERERERERGERLLHFAARGNKKERTTIAHCTLSLQKEEETEKPTKRREEKRVRASLRSRFSLSFARGDRYAVF
jgi:hypothetical protein